MDEIVPRETKSLLKEYKVKTLNVCLKSHTVDELGRPYVDFGVFTFGSTPTDLERVAAQQSAGQVFTPVP